MIFKSILLLFFFTFASINGARFRFDYTYNRSAKGWLKLHLVPAKWSDAKLLCHAEGAVLASPTTVYLHDAMVEIAKNEYVKTIFTGVHTTFSKGSYASIEGIPLLRMSISWAQGEPDNFENTEECLAMTTTTNGTMKDVKCSDVYPFVCYKKKTETIVLTECGTHDTEYNLDKRTGSCYKFHRRSLSWQQAYMTCMAEGGHLVVINSDQESVVLKELYAKYPNSMIVTKHPDFAYIGLYDSGDGGYWMTIHGETPTEAEYDKWVPGQPDNAVQPLGEFCGVTDRATTRLLDAPCNWHLPFICEKKPDSLEPPEEVLYSIDRRRGVDSSDGEI